MADSQSNEKTFTLFYFPTSYSSQKVLLAFYEKEILFKPKLVSLFSGQHNAPWYVQLNPEGSHVPVLRHDNNIITQPEKIIDYIDRSPESTVPRLIPNDGSELGKQVQSMRKKLDAVEMDIITYGIIFHPHLSKAGCRISGAVQRSMKENFANRLSVLTELATKHPSLRDSYLMKSQVAAQKFDVITDAAKVQRHLETLQSLLEEVEKQLKSIKTASQDIADDLWLFGPMYTAADISLTVLLSRLNLLGLDSLLFPLDKKPYIQHYLQQVKNRPSYVQIQKEIANLRLTLVWENLKAASPYILGISVAALIGGGLYLTYKKLQE